jgi:hypothetical protein
MIGLGLFHDPADQFLAGRGLVDEPGDHSATPGPRIEVAVLQGATVSFAADQVANVVDGGPISAPVTSL